MTIICFNIPRRNRRFRKRMSALGLTLFLAVAGCSDGTGCRSRGDGVKSDFREVPGMFTPLLPKDTIMAEGGPPIPVSPSLPIPESGKPPDVQPSRLWMGTAGVGLLTFHENRLIRIPGLPNRIQRIVIGAQNRVYAIAGHRAFQLTDDTGVFQPERPSRPLVPDHHAPGLVVEHLAAGMGGALWLDTPDVLWE